MVSLHHEPEMVLKARISLGSDLEALSSGQGYRIDPKRFPVDPLSSCGVPPICL